MSLKYLDTLKQDPPPVYEMGCTQFTFKKMDESGVYKTISNEEWGPYDYSSWFTPDYSYTSEQFTVYIPLDDCLENGQYQIFYQYSTFDLKRVYFQTTVEFTLHRGN